MNRSRALLILAECTGDDIWSIQHCQKRQVPETWIRQLRDAYESGFDSHDSMIYYDHQVVNQFEGVRDVDLACKIGKLLGVDIKRILQSHSTRTGVVHAIREAIEDGE